MRFDEVLHELDSLGVSVLDDTCRDDVRCCDLGYTDEELDLPGRSTKARSVKSGPERSTQTTFLENNLSFLYFRRVSVCRSRNFLVVVLGFNTAA